MPWGSVGEKPDLSQTKKIGLPAAIANIAHTLWSKKIVKYKLAKNYTWINIPPRVLHRLQAAEVWCSMVFDFGKDKDIFKFLKVTDGKIIHTITKEKDMFSNEHIIQSCIDNPINLCELDIKPSFQRHVKYNWKDYFFLSFQDVAIQRFAREDFVLVSFDEKQWLEAKNIGHIEYASGREINISDVDWIPTLTITYPNPNTPEWKYVGWENRHTDTFNLKDQERKNDVKFHKLEQQQFGELEEWIKVIQSDYKFISICRGEEWPLLIKSNLDWINLYLGYTLELCNKRSLCFFWSREEDVNDDRKLKDNTIDAMYSDAWRKLEEDGITNIKHLNTLIQSAVASRKIASVSGKAKKD